MQFKNKFPVIYFLIITLLFIEQLSAKQVRVDLNEAIEPALSNNQTCIICQQQLAISAPQHKQAWSAYWPKIDTMASWKHCDENTALKPASVSTTASTPLDWFNVEISATKITLLD